MSAKFLSILFPLLGFATWDLLSTSAQESDPTKSESELTIQERIISAAEHYLGEPYVLGDRLEKPGCLSGNQRINCRSGIDCQSLIFFAYENALGTHWTRFSVIPSVCVRENQLGHPVEGLDGVLAEDLDVSKLQKADVLFFLLKDYNMDADQPLWNNRNDQYGVWHTGLVAWSFSVRCNVIHAKPGHKVLIEALQDIQFDAVFVVRIAE